MKVRRKNIWFLGILVLAVILLAVFAPVLTPQDPYLQDLGNALQPPEAGHLLGTDQYGRDMRTRVCVRRQNYGIVYTGVDRDHHRSWKPDWNYLRIPGWMAGHDPHADL